MIRYRVDMPRKGPVVFLGLSDENVKRLRAGRPIRIAATDEIGLGVEVVIYHGATEVDLTRELEENGILPPGSTAKTEEAMRKRGEFRTPNTRPESGTSESKSR